MTDQRAMPVRFDSSAVPAEMYLRIRASVGTAPAPKIRTRGRIAAALLAVPCLTAAIVMLVSDSVYGQQAVGLDFGIRSTPHLLFVLVGLVGLTLATTLVAIRRGWHGLGSGSLLLAMTAGLATPLYALLTLADPVHGNGLAAPAGVIVSVAGYRCLALAATVGLLALASFTIALRRSVPVASGLRGAVLGAAAGVWAGLGVFVFCPSGDHHHLLTGHVLPILALTLLAAMAIPRVLRP